MNHNNNTNIRQKNTRFIIKCEQFELDLTSRTHIMGILNVTPDSFSDGGQYNTVPKAVDRAYEMWKEGADIIDIGGESTRPPQTYGGVTKRINSQEEIDRIVPVIEKVSALVNCPISVDTYKSDVAKAALSAGAHIINDISGLRFDPGIKEVARQYSAPVIIMHMKGTPQTMQDNPKYDDIIFELYDFFSEKIKEAEIAGLNDIIIDPGFGFGKSIKDNYIILNRLEEFHELNRPILIGTSRKTFIGKELATSDRKEGTAATVSWGISKGVHIVRVHDVKEMLRVANITDKIIRAA